MDSFVTLPTVLKKFVEISCPRPLVWILSPRLLLFRFIVRPSLDVVTHQQTVRVYPPTSYDNTLGSSFHVIQVYSLQSPRLSSIVPGVEFWNSSPCRETYDPLDLPFCCRFSVPVFVFWSSVSPYLLLCRLLIILTPCPSQKTRVLSLRSLS